MKARDLARVHICYKVGRNSSFLLWHDPWLENQPLIYRFGSVIRLVDSYNFAKASSMMNDTGWNPHPSNHVLAIELRHLLLNSEVQTCDSILWDGQKTATIASIWDSLRNAMIAPLWIPTIWHSWAIKKCSIFLWLALKNRLLTKDRMLHFGMNVNPVCLLCKVMNESAEHLFCSCTYSLQILSCSPIRLTNNWAGYLQGQFSLVSTTQVQKQVLYLYMAVAVHCIWRERNERLHGSVGRSAKRLLLEVKRVVREKLFTCNSFKKAVRKDMLLVLLLY